MRVVTHILRLSPLSLPTVFLYVYQLTSVLSPRLSSPTILQSMELVINLISESIFNFKFISKLHQPCQSLSLYLGQLHSFSSSVRYVGVIWVRTKDLQVLVVGVDIFPAYHVADENSVCFCLFVFVFLILSQFIIVLWRTVPGNESVN